MSSGGAPTPAGTSVFTKYNWDMGMGYLWLTGLDIYDLMEGHLYHLMGGHLSLNPLGPIADLSAQLT